MQVGQGGIHGGEILLHHRFAALLVGLLDGLLDGGDGFLARQHAADGEEAGLHDGVDAASHARFFGHRIGVDDVELQLLIEQLLLHRDRQVVPDFLRRVRAVEQEGRARLRQLEHIEALHERELMAGHKIRLRDEIGGTDGPRPEAQVRYRHGAGFLRVIDEVALGVEVGVLADDLDGVLVGAHGAVRPQAVEDGAHGVGALGGELAVVIQAGAGDVVDDADREVVLGLRLLHLVEDGLHHRGIEFLRGEPVAAADHSRHRLEWALAGG